MNDQRLNDMLHSLSENRGTKIVFARGVEHFDQEIETVSLCERVANLASGLLFKLKLIFGELCKTVRVNQQILQQHKIVASLRQEPIKVVLLSICGLNLEKRA